MCRYSPDNPKNHYACLDCRITFKKHGGEYPCPKCGKIMVALGRDFKAPRKQNKAQWDKVRKLFEAGFDFDSCGCDGPGYRPKYRADVKRFLKESQEDGYRFIRPVQSHRRTKKYQW